MKNDIKKIIFFSIFIFNIFFITAQLYDNGTVRVTDLTITEKDGENIYRVWLDGKKIKSNYKNVNAEREIDFVKGDYPVLMTGYPLIDVMYAMAIKECELNIKDSVFVAGEKWNQGWTRDTSYSVILSLYSIFNQISYNSLKSRVFNGKVLQDTGTGGSFPISTDRVVWIIAAYYVAIFSSNQNIYSEFYEISKNTMLQHINVVFDENLNLFRGEQSFLDWREQTYPIWASPSDIGYSYALGTNVLHFKALEILRLMAKKLGKNEDYELWDKYYKLVQEGINKNFYSQNKEYFASYLLKGIYKDFLYEGYETLGNSLAVLWNLVDRDKGINILNAVRPSKYGMPVVAPQFEGIRPYHNDAIWPFVQSYRALAAAKMEDIDVFSEEFYQVIRSAGMFLTFKENLVCSTGDRDGTAINSDRQLWSVSGFLGMVLNGLAGINITEEGLFFKPIKPIGFRAPINLTNFKYKNATINISVRGFGTVVDSITVNKKKVENNYILPENSSGVFNIEIVLKPDQNKIIKKEYKFEANDKIKIIENLDVEDGNRIKKLMWFKKEEDNDFLVYKNGEVVIQTKENSFEIGIPQGVDEYFVCRNYEKVPQLKGKQYLNVNKNFVIVLEAENAQFSGGEVDTEILQSNVLPTRAARLDEEFNRFSYNGNGYLKKWGKEKEDSIEWRIKTKNEGYYIIDFRYQNGGPINTGEKCSIKELEVNGEKFIYYFPHSGNWKEWIFSFPLKIYLKSGENIIKLYNSDRTLSQKDIYPVINIDLVRLRKL